MKPYEKHDLEKHPEPINRTYFEGIQNKK